MSQFTIVEKLPDHLDYHCGYCTNDSASAGGMWAHSMNCIDYQSLIDRGWRRSGKYCYKPIMHKTCCPQYTIRCKALEYKLTKSKKKAIKKMRQFLMTEGDHEVMKWREKHSEESKKKTIEHQTTEAAESSCSSGGLLSKNCSHSGESSHLIKAKKEVTRGLGPDPSKPICKKAKAIRLEKHKLKKHAQESGDSLALQANKLCPEKKCDNLSLPHLDNSPANKRKFEVRTIRANVFDKEFQKSKAESHAVYQKYQTTIHGDDMSECTESQWIRFLVDCPLNHDTDGPGPGYGNYHQQYILDGKIIAVGVVDILPNCVSSVYLYYDPDYGFLSLGVYTALSEIAYTRELHKESNLLEYYYMGFYIHSCPKMNYKREYPPSYLLCPETYEWVPIQLCLKALDENKYSRLNILNGGSSTATDTERGSDSDVDSIGILYKRSVMNFHQYSRWNYPGAYFGEANNGEESRADSTGGARSILLQQRMKTELAELKEYVSLVGTTCAKRMLLYRSHEAV